MYDLPPNPTKPTDTRRAAFVAKNGDVSVELDALPADILQTRLTEEVEQYMDMNALDKVKGQEDSERQQIVVAFHSIGG